MRWSDDSPGAASHFACAYRVASPGATREPCESSWGHVLVFCTVPPANTLIRWVDERRLRPHSAGSTLPHLWPTGSSRGGPHRLRPGTSPHALRIPPHGGHPALRVTRGGCRSPLAVSGFRLRARLGFSIPSSPRPARNYPRFRIRRPSSGRRRDLNPPDHHAAQRTLWSAPIPGRPCRPASLPSRDGSHPVRLCSSLHTSPTPAWGQECSGQATPKACRYRGGDGRASQVPGEPPFPFALFSRRRQDCGHQTGTVPQRGPWYVKSRGSRERSFDAQ
jgi:hypothetical protein